jgi:hypothetical protein
MPDFPSQVKSAKNNEAGFLPGIGATVGGTVGGPGGAGMGAAAGVLGKPFLTDEPANLNEAATTGLEYAAAQKGGDLAVQGIGKGLGWMIGPKIQSAVEGIFRAVPSENPNYRDNVVAALGDLQNMVKSGAIPERTKGGILNPEMYFRQVNEAIDQRLKDMFNNEYMGQINIAKKAGAQIGLTENPQVMQQALKYIARTQTADSGARAAALKLAGNPTAQVPIEDAAELARAVNAHLRELSAARPEAAYVSAQKSATKASLQRLDSALSDSINGKLQSLDQPGVAGYERRYAALSAINRQIESGMNSLERQRLEIRPRAGVSLKGRGWASGVANIFKGNAGADLEDALLALKNSPDIPTPVAGPRVVLQGQYAGQAGAPSSSPAIVKQIPRTPVWAQLPPPKP